MAYRLQSTLNPEGTLYGTPAEAKQAMEQMIPRCVVYIDMANIRKSHDGYRLAWEWFKYTLMNGPNWGSHIEPSSIWMRLIVRKEQRHY